MRALDRVVHMGCDHSLYLGFDHDDEYVVLEEKYLRQWLGLVRGVGFKKKHKEEEATSTATSGGGRILVRGWPSLEDICYMKKN